MALSIDCLWIRTTTFHPMIGFSTWPPYSGLPIQTTIPILLSKSLLQLLQLFWAQHTPYAGLIHNDPAEKQKLSSLEWLGEVVCPHIICRAELNRQFSGGNPVLHEIIPDVNMAGPL